MQDEPRWPDIDSDQTEVLPVVPVGPAPGPQRRTRRLRNAGWIGGGALGVLVVAYLIDLLTSQGQVPRGVIVAGVDVGGLERPVAERELRGQLETRLARPLTVTGLFRWGH